jgi:hypothetical protein
VNRINSAAVETVTAEISRFHNHRNSKFPERKADRNSGLNIRTDAQRSKPQNSRDVAGCVAACQD